MRGALGGLGWLVAVIVIALGGAGIVTAMDAPPSGEARPELTARGDALVTPVLDAAEASLTTLADDVDALGTQARGALAAQVANDMATLDGAVARGDELIASIKADAASIAADLATAPIIGTTTADYELSAAVRARHARLVDAVETLEGLDAAWARLTTGAVTATRLSGLLAAHDDAVLAAAEQGRDAEYDDAAATLDGADAAIAEARQMRDRLANTVDVTVLDEWLDRNEAYDVALRGLYVALRDVGGRVTDAVRDAIAAEKAAKERLPPDSRGLILIMAEIGRGGMNGAVIAIEETKGRLAAALEPAPELAPSAAPLGSPAATP